MKYVRYVLLALFLISIPVSCGYLYKGFNSAGSAVKSAASWGGSLFQKSPGYEELGFVKLTKERLKVSLEKHEKLFMVFTAKWCPTCITSGEVIKTPEVIQALKDKGYTLYLVDLTRLDDYYNKLLKYHNSAGLPTYILYPGHGKYKEIPLTGTPPYIDKDNLIKIIEES
jgi:thiol:disulfide interchange protein